MRFTAVVTCIFLLGIYAGPSLAQSSNCQNDTLSKNSDGEILVLSSGGVFEPLAGDKITAKLWLPQSELLLCGPNYFSFKGRDYQLFDVTNVSDGETVTAIQSGGGVAAGGRTGRCYKSNIVKPTPFLGNDGEVFALTDGSIWEVRYEYEYLYEYYPTIIACPGRGYIVVGDKQLNAEMIR